MNRDHLIKSLLSIDLNSPGAPRRITECGHLISTQFPGGAISLVSEHSTSLEDDRILMLISLSLIDASDPGSAIEECMKAIGLPSMQMAQDFFERGLLLVIEYSWTGQLDPDAVEYQQWACNQLVRISGPIAEAIIFSRLATQRDTRKKRSLIEALGIMSHAPLLHKLTTETVEYLLAVLSDDAQSTDVHDVVREVLLEDVLRTDKEQPYLPQKLRLVIESIRRPQP